MIQTRCGLIPPAPPSIDIIRNMSLAKDRVNPMWFRDMVKNKWPWDYKQQGAIYQDFGNFNYGATGAAFGFYRSVLLQEAGRAQQAAGTSRAEWVTLQKIGGIFMAELHRTVMTPMIRALSMVGLIFADAWGSDEKIVYFIFIVLLSGCFQIFSDENCRDEKMGEKISPDGAIVAQILKRDCGATASSAVGVYLKHAGRINKSGEKIYILRGVDNISIGWEGPVLRINAPGFGDNVFLKKEEWNGTRIIYQ
ncbi:hypothetical protein [Acidovorax sp. SUPP2539]|uniref:hypothetical protein n=1 Tax=Acidovorax sp. SUPP2539 TaxID=2920878 RepID=UPI0023DE3904|nr:hypothetical protein [Acidovorax sp. SUPP2539]GKS90702.1 hypothetical protein AVTE2539_15075 [Acidovorax sp. SUPP2539]